MQEAHIASADSAAAAAAAAAAVHMMGTCTIGVDSILCWKLHRLDSNLALLAMPRGAEGARDEKLANYLLESPTLAASNAAGSALVANAVVQDNVAAGSQQLGFAMQVITLHLASAYRAWLPAALFLLHSQMIDPYDGT